MAFVDVRDLVKSYTAARGQLEVLHGLSLSVEQGEMLAIVGASGVGKSTLLHVLGGLDAIDAGTVRIGDASIGQMNDEARVAFRNQNVGFVFQFHHLLPEFSALENVLLPQMIRGLSRDEATTRAIELLEYLGLGGRLSHRPAELSGGEQQRVAIARAVANAPRILLADEPTGNLDLHTAEHVFRALIQLVKASGLAAIIATHNMDLAARMDRRVTLREGTIVEMD